MRRYDKGAQGELHKLGRGPGASPGACLLMGKVIVGQQQVVDADFVSVTFEGGGGGDS